MTRQPTETSDRLSIYLIRGCGISPSRTRLLMAPLGLGMMCTYPFMGALTRHVGLRRLAMTGGLLALAGTLPFLYLARHGVVFPILVGTLFLRGAGMSAIGVPTITSAYASVERRTLPMATTAMNIVQRLGGPTLTTLCATFLGWRLAHTPGAASLLGVFAPVFGLMSFLQALLFLATSRLPSLDATKAV